MSNPVDESHRLPSCPESLPLPGPVRVLIVLAALLAAWGATRVSAAAIFWNVLRQYPMHGDRCTRHAAARSGCWGRCGRSGVCLPGAAGRGSWRRAFSAVTLSGTGLIGCSGSRRVRTGLLRWFCRWSGCSFPWAPPFIHGRDVSSQEGDS